MLNLLLVAVRINIGRFQNIRYLKFHLLGFMSIVFLSSCDLINPTEEIPAYLEIEPFEVTTRLGNQGSASSKITEGWVFVGSDFLGAYTLPATIPVLLKDEQTVLIQAGIKDNGIPSLSEIYPFYQTDSFNVNLQAATVTTVQPQTTYEPNVIFEFIEDFENGSIWFTEYLEGNGNTELTTTSNEVFEGNRSGKVVLTPDNPIVAVATRPNRKFKDLQKRGVFVYLEVNYKSDVPVLWGLIGHEEANSTVGTEIFDPGFNAKSEWNKIYFNLSSLVFEGGFDFYQIGFTAVLPSENGEFSTERAEIYLDNIKLLHF